jgi:hypothetical protein
MFKKIEEGLEIYRQALKNYKEKIVDPLRIQGEVGKSVIEIERNNSELIGMAKALGLTKEEIKHFDQEADIS